MLIACIVVVCLFIIFISTTYFMTRKSYSFEFEGKKVKFENAGSQSKIFVDDTLVQAYHMPQLIKGEEFKIEINQKELLIKCKTNWFGNKLSMQVLNGEEEVFNNGVIIKEKKQ